MKNVRDRSLVQEFDGGMSARIDLVHAAGNLSRPPTKSDVSSITVITYV